MFLSLFWWDQCIGIPQRIGGAHRCVMGDITLPLCMDRNFSLRLGWPRNIYSANGELETNDVFYTLQHRLSTLQVAKCWNTRRSLQRGQSFFRIGQRSHLICCSISNVHLHRCGSKLSFRNSYVGNFCILASLCKKLTTDICVEI